MADALLGRGLGRGERVALMLPSGQEYFAVFLGTLLAGGVPVPIYPPAQMAVLEAHLQRQRHLLDNAGAAILVTVSEAMVAARLVRAQVSSLRDVVTARALLGSPPQGIPLPAVGPDDVALIQYTSGSTGDPKGVVLSHRQIVTNVVGMGRAVSIDSSDVVVTWLPLYHDMGLIGCWHTPLVFGVPAVVMSPLAFLAHPASWLAAISANGGTISVGPNFAYQACVDRVGDDELRHVDLSTWRVAISGSEPVSAGTVDRFCERFAARGFRREAFCPAYGLAEMGVGVCFTPLGRGPRVDSIDRLAMQETGRARPVGPDSAGAESVVSCGRTLAGYDVRVVDPAGAVLAERREGSVQCRGPSATSGYHDNPAATATLWRDGWLDTGDLGYLSDGELFVTGRTKDIIIRGGRKYHPEELEQRLGLLADVFPGGAAVIARLDPRLGTERVVVVLETASKDETTRRSLQVEAAHVCHDLLGLVADEVVLVAPGAILRTASGKVRRNATGDALDADALTRGAAPAVVQLARFGFSGVLASIGRARRAPGTLLYGLFAYAVLVPAAAGAVIISWAPVGVRRRAALAGSLVRAVCRTLGISFDVDGRFPDDGAARVVVANHSSFIDALALFAAVTSPPVFVASVEIGRTALLGTVVRRFGTVFVQRGRPRQAAADGELVDVVRRGRQLVVFPEGSLSGAVGVRPFHLGAFDAAVEGGARIVPVGIRGTRQVLAPGSRWPRRGAIRVVVGEPISPSGTDFSAKVALRDAARREVARLSAQDELGAG